MSYWLSKLLLKNVRSLYALVPMHEGMRYERKGKNANTLRLKRGEG